MLMKIKDIERSRPVQTKYELWVFGVGTDYEWLEHDIEFKKKKDIELFIKTHIPNYISYKIVKQTRQTIKEYIPAHPDYYIG